MTVTLINASVRRGNNSTRTVGALGQHFRTNDMRVHTVHLDAFTTLFSGTYISYQSATSAQRQVIDTMCASDALLFVVPTYYKSVPGVLKNFFDIVKEPDMYANKTIGFVSSNHKNQDFGARHAQLIVQGLLEFFDIQAVIVPEIPIIDPDAIDADTVDRAAIILQNHYGLLQ